MHLRRIILIALVLILSYFLGYSQCQFKNSTQQLGKIKHVSQLEKEIMAQPPVGKSDLLELMHRSKF